MRTSNKIFFIISAAVLLTATGCKKLLQEQPRSQITPSFFSTSGGILGGIAGVYSDMRFLWGTEGFTNITMAGTDEVLAGGSASGSYFWTYNNILTSDGAVTALWNIAYQDINTLNGVLQFGAASTTIDSATKRQYLAQAKFIRGFYYFYLVQTFGSVPLHTTFITNATTSDSRASVADVYTQIIQDLTQASTELQVKPTAPFLGKPGTQAAALFLLSKVYLTRGWATGSSGDFSTAATIASNLITNAATYGIGLNTDYATANAPGNEYNQEVLFVIDREADLKYGERTTGSRASGNKENGLNFFFRPNYPTVNANYPAAGGLAIMTRDIPNGRPFIRIRPNTNYVLNEAFTDMADDSRYDKTFQTVWIANTAGVTTPRGALTVGKDTGIWCAPFEVPAATVASFKGVIFTPAGTNGANAYTTVMYPSMSKYDDPNRADVNDASTRPEVMFKLSEAYLIAAEAYLKAGDATSAANMLNVIRKRAAFRSANSPAQNTTAATNMIIAPGQVTIDFILDERSRELYGECQRWWDLVRTQTLSSRLQTWNPTEAFPHYSTSSPANAFMLRPIPQTEIDLVTTGPKFPQNPGY
jgi:hypothetical protein